MNTAKFELPYYQIYLDIIALPSFQSNQGKAMNLAESLYNLGYRKVEPVELEALEDDDINFYIIDTEPERRHKMCKRVSQATIQRNQEKFGKLFRLKL